MAERKNKAVRAGVGYTVGNYLLKALSVAAMPVFARLMTTADYGLFNTYLSYGSILTILIGLMLQESLKSAKYRFGAEFDRYVSTCLMASLAVFAAWLIAANALFPIYRDALGFDRLLTNLLLFYSYGNALISCFNVYVGLDYEYKSFFKVAALNGAGSLALSAALIAGVFRDCAYVGRILGTVAPAIGLGAWILVYFFRRSKPARGGGYLTFALRYSAPIIPHGLSQVVLANFDRIMLEKLSGASAAGLYSFGYTINTLISIAANSLDSAWGPWFFERMNEGDERAVRVNANRYAFGMLAFSGAVMLVSPEAIRLLGSAAYADAAYCTMPLTIAGYFAFLALLPMQAEYYFGSTRRIALGTAAAAALNVALNAAFIPKFGYVAAAYITMATYLIYFLVHCAQARGAAGRNLFDGRCMAALTVGALALCGVGEALMDYWIARWALAALIGCTLLVWADRRFGLRGLLRRRAGGK